MQVKEEDGMLEETPVGRISVPSRRAIEGTRPNHRRQQHVAYKSIHHVAFLWDESDSAALQKFATADPLDQVNEDISILEKQIARITAHKERMQAMRLAAGLPTGMLPPARRQVLVDRDGMEVIEANSPRSSSSEHSDCYNSSLSTEDADGPAAAHKMHSSRVYNGMRGGGSFGRGKAGLKRKIHNEQLASPSSPWERRLKMLEAMNGGAGEAPLGYMLHFSPSEEEVNITDALTDARPEGTRGLVSLMQENSSLLGRMDVADELPLHAESSALLGSLPRTDSQRLDEANTSEIVDDASTDLSDCDSLEQLAIVGDESAIIFK